MLTIYYTQAQIQKAQVASMEVRIGVSTEQCTYICTSHQHKAGQNHTTMTASQSFENEAKFIYLENTLTNNNCM